MEHACQNAKKARALSELSQNTMDQSFGLKDSFPGGWILPEIF
jgi:hypothetical protein